ncbi:MAG: cytochrome ubiquinol oxidase subunit II [Candidatus Micrarchaeota archaeon]|nr:MAG: cytochrome ubiquinol oxidase subunit II [Candidatus Micrarchaeota archaeon]
MNTLILINYLVFALFLTAFMIEIGVALLLLIDYKRKDKLLRYLMPIWAADGTFGIFYVVDLEATYPSAVPLIGKLYATFLLIAGLIFIFRNAFIEYAEYISRRSSKRAYHIVYISATAIVTFIALSLLASTISGIGVDLNSQSIDSYALIFNPFSILLFISGALASFFIASTIFNFGKVKLKAASIALSILLILIGFYLYAYNIYKSLISNPLLLILPISIIILSIAMQASKIRAYSKYIAILSLFISILSIEIAEYPYIFNGSIDLNSIVIAGSEAYYLTIFFAGGIILLAALLTIMLYFGLISRQVKLKA